MRRYAAGHDPQFGKMGVTAGPTALRNARVAPCARRGSEAEDGASLVGGATRGALVAHDQGRLPSPGET